MKRLLRTNQVANHFKQSFIYRKVSPFRNVMNSRGTDTSRILHPLLPGLQLFGLREIKCATDTLPSKERSSFDIEFCPKNCCSKTLGWLSRFRNCLEKVRSSNLDRDRAKRVIGVAHWSPKCSHSSRAAKVGAQITQFRSELSRTWSVGTVWALETNIEPHFVKFMPFSCLHSPLNRSTANWALRNKVCNGDPFFQGMWLL